jgi:hypothetical protein
MEDKEKSKAAVSLGRLGGEATKKKYGVDYYKKIGSMKRKKKNDEEEYGDNSNHKGRPDREVFEDSV